jgi:hypothetical protein
VPARGQQLRDENEQYDLSRRLRVGARAAARAEGDDEQGGVIAAHPAKGYATR